MQRSSQPQSFSGSVVESAPTGPAFAPPAPGSNVQLNQPTVTSRPDPTASAPKKSHASLIETIILVFVSLVAVTFIGLFVWKYLEWDTVRTDVEGQIDEAVAIAVAENTAELEAEFTEREKYPYKAFTGPADYGSVSFEYPKTWNVYVAKDAANGGDFEAYFNPGEVQPVSTSTINALRITITTGSFDDEIRSFENHVKSGRLTLATRNIGSAVANVYSGQLSNTMQGIVTLFKLRDKVVTIQTDAMIFSEEYYKLLDTITIIE